ncbi:hypothetical protein PHMEG_00012014 [Phytophthora megakarya]|uniref:Uncharacterized protein n=1 Tax=Phytophthora megakarya TaxID=4795 RepID=A0A225WBY4_9STRA|nr:hypothetical protein PHMEG_00012014 [Phytophthora megakarya]
MTTSARRVSDPPPLRSSKRAAAKSVGEVPPTDGRKGERKTAKRVPPVASKKNPRVAAAASESESEEKVPAPSTKRPKKTLVPAPEMSSMPDDPRATVTSRSSQPETVSARVEEAAGKPEALSLLEEQRALNTEVRQLRGLVGASEEAVAVRASVTVANTKGELPPAKVCYLTSGSSPESSKKAKGDYNPHKLTCWLRAACSGRLVLRQTSYRHLRRCLFRGHPMPRVFFLGRAAKRDYTVLVD